MFFVLFSNIFLRVFRGHFKGTFDESESKLFKPFFINLNFDLGVFPNLSSKVLAGI